MRAVHFLFVSLNLSSPNIVDTFKGLDNISRIKGLGFKINLNDLPPYSQTLPICNVVVILQLTSCVIFSINNEAFLC